MIYSCIQQIFIGNLVHGKKDIKPSNLNLPQKDYGLVRSKPNFNFKKRRIHMTEYFVIRNRALSITNQIPYVILKFLSLSFSTFSLLFIMKPVHAFKMRRHECEGIYRAWLVASRNFWICQYFLKICKMCYNFKVCSCKNSYTKWQKNHVNCAIDVEIKSYISEEKNLAES